VGTSTFTRTASLRETRVQTFTVAAVQELPLVAGRPTAVSLVPITPAVVVVVVATTIADICHHPALFLTRAFTFLRKFGVSAQALLAIRKLPLVSRFAAAVARIPSASTIVVLVIASAVTRVIRYTAFAFAVRFRGE